MTVKLIELGYQNIAFLCETNDEWTRGSSRRAGFKKAMEAAGLSAHRMIRIGTPPMTIKNGYTVGKNIRQYFDDIDCIFCVSDAPAFGVLTALQEDGVKVPDDVGVAGFGNFEIGRFSKPSISTVVVDPVVVGQLTADLVVELLNHEPGKGRVTKKHTVDLSIELRESTRRNQ